MMNSERYYSRQVSDNLAHLATLLLLFFMAGIAAIPGPFSISLRRNAQTNPTSETE